MTGDERFAEVEIRRHAMQSLANPLGEMNGGSRICMEDARARLKRRPQITPSMTVSARTEPMRLHTSQRIPTMMKPAICPCIGA